MQVTADTTVPDQDETVNQLLSLPMFDVNAAHIVIHRVECGGDGLYHDDHESEEHYYDVPRLLANANRTSVLRGQHLLSDPEWLLEDHPAISFVVRNTYDCGRYHEQISDQFERLWMPLGISESIVGQVRPYFSVLTNNAALAEREDQVIVPSKGLKRAMSTLKSSFPSQLRNWDDEDNLTYPYLQLWHCKDLLRVAVNNMSDPAQQLHSNALLSYLESEGAAEWEEAEKLFSDGRVNKKHWAKLFRPNDLVVTMDNGEPRAYVVRDCPTVGDDSLVLACWSWKFDGEFHLQYPHHKVTWPSESDTVPISDLVFYPLRFDKSDLKERLERRGRVFWSCRKRRYVSYNVSPEETGLGATQLRYMIDTMTYRTLHKHDEDFVRGDLDGHAMLSDDPPEATQYPYFVLLLPVEIKGFGFHNKKWNDLRVERIKEISWDKNVFKHSLVMDQGKKELIQALVTVHVKRKASTKADFMTGKGEGLLILLHGGPGTGKTLTAESVAELAERPLYRVTCGDIGTDPETVETYLNSVLYIGVTWNCVVLLDEADVFLEERTKLDMERNALVSVFLRVLEYYEGILILTSNRIGTFDEAFKSRVQLSLHYPPLSESNRLEVWDNFVEHLKQGDEDVDFEGIQRKFRILARYQLNGRQIRNTLNTARQLAQFRGQRLEYDHLQQAIKNVVEFETYVTKLHDGQTDEEYAEAAGIRHGNTKAEKEYD